MAQQALPYGQSDNDPNPANSLPIREAWKRTGEMFSDLYSSLSTITDAGAFEFSGELTTEEKIDAALASALASGDTIVRIPFGFIPYDVTLLTNLAAFTAAGGRLVREGGSLDVYDVLAYGAQFPGVSDHTAILAAGNAAAANKGACYFPPGFYQVGADVIFDAIRDTQFIGAGGNSSALVAAGDNITLLGFTDACSGIVVRDLFIVSFAARTGCYGLRVEGSVSIPCNQIDVSDVVVQNISNPIYLQLYNNSSWRNIRVIQSIAGAVTGAVLHMNRTISMQINDFIAYTTAGTFPANGVEMDYECDSVLISTSQVLDCAGWGFRALNSGGASGPRLSRWTNCLAESNTLGGFGVVAARDLRMSGCHAAVNGGYGYNISGGDSVTITDSLALQNQTHGILVDGGNGVKLEGNTCSNNSQLTNNAYDGIRIHNNVTHVRVTGNRSGDFIYTLANKQRSGLSLGTGSDYLYVGVNDLRGNLGAGFEQPIINASTGANNQYSGSRFFAASEALLVAGIDTESVATIVVATTLTAARVVGSLYNPFKGQRVAFTFIQNGTGGWAVTWNAVYKHSWVDTGNTASKRSSIAFVFDGTNWNQDGAQSPYV